VKYFIIPYQNLIYSLVELIPHGYIRVPWISANISLLQSILSPHYLQVVAMNAEFHVLGQPYRLVDVQAQINSAAGRAVDGHLKQQLDNHACSSYCH
jgi:hypothetical protein